MYIYMYVWKEQKTNGVQLTSDKLVYIVLSSRYLVQIKPVTSFFVSFFIGLTISDF